MKEVMKILVRGFFWIMFRFFVDLGLDSAAQKTLELYEGGGFVELFNKIRFWDAPMKEIERMVPKKGVVVDLGSGDGLMGNYLALASGKRCVYGYEISGMRAKEANRGVRNAEFKQGDIRKVSYPKADCVLLIDVLHHLPNRQDQEEVLKNIKKNLKSGGKLIVAEIVERPILKYWFTWITDAITVPILFEGKLFSRDFYYRKDDEWLELFEKLGYKVQRTEAHEGKPFSHVVYELR